MEKEKKLEFIFNFNKLSKDKASIKIIDGLLQSIDKLPIEDKLKLILYEQYEKLN